MRSSRLHMSRSLRLRRGSARQRTIAKTPRMSCGRCAVPETRSSRNGTTSIRREDGRSLRSPASGYGATEIPAQGGIGTLCQGADRGPLVSGLGVSRRTRCAISTRTGPPPALGPPGHVILLRYDCVNIARGVRLATGAPASERGTPRGDGLPRSNATKTTPEQDHDDAKRGDRAALGRLLAAHRPMLVTIFRAFAPLGAVRDLVAAANAKAVAAFPRQHGGVGALAEWLRGVARSVWIDALRKHAPETAAARRREVRGTQRTAAADRRWRAEDGDAAPRRSDFARRVAEVQARDEERTARGLPR